MHRALRLVIATGFAAAVVCLVVGLAALMVKIGTRLGAGPAIAAPEAIDPNAGHESTKPAAAPAPPGIAGRTVKFYTGSGRARRGPFLIGAPGDWGLAWAFDCGAVHDRHFAVTERSPYSGHGVAVAAAGLTGRGHSWTSHDPGQHELGVNSPCSWSIKIVLAPSR